VSGSPDSWPEVALGQVCLPVDKADPVSTGRTSIRYVDIGSVDGGRQKLQDVSLIDAASAPSRARQILKTGDVVFSTVRPYLKKIASIPPDLDGEFGSTGFCVLRAGASLDPRYLYYFATSQHLLEQVLPLQRGVSYPAVRDGDVKASTIPLPPLDEQRRIVATLEDHLSRLDMAALALQSANRRAANLWRASLETTTCPHTAEMRPLSTVVDRIEAGKSYKCETRRAHDDEWGIIKVSAMTWGAFKPEENKAVPASGAVDPRFEIVPGDILVSRANTVDYVGAPVLVGETRPKLLLSDKSLRLVPSPETDRQWLQFVLASPRVRRQISDRATGTKDSMRNISQQNLLAVEIPVLEPNRQRESARELAEVRVSIDRLQSALDAADIRRRGLQNSLMATAFEGGLCRG